MAAFDGRVKVSPRVLHVLGTHHVRHVQHVANLRAVAVAVSCERGDAPQW